MTEAIEIYEGADDHSRALVRASTPTEFVEKASEIATALAAVVEDRKLFQVISGRKHVLVEGWTFLGSMMGAFGNPVYAVCEWTKPLLDENGQVVGYEARVVARTLDGAIVGAAESMCTRSERTWANRADYALRSMAQTRATSKALRQPLGFLMQLAGYDATPSEEMPESTPPMYVTIGPGQLEDLLEVLEPAAALMPELWDTKVVLANAARRFGRPIEKYSDLTIVEAETIIDGVNSWMRDKPGLPEPVEEEDELEFK